MSYTRIPAKLSTLSSIKPRALWHELSYIHALSLEIESHYRSIAYHFEWYVMYSDEIHMQNSKFLEAFKIHGHILGKTNAPYRLDRKKSRERREAAERKENKSSL